MDPKESNISHQSFGFGQVILYITASIFSLVGILILARSIVNAAFLKGYEQGNYSEMTEAMLMPLRFGDNYVVPYNLGNAAFMHGDYNRAVSCFQTALDSDPPEYDEECRIRVNLAFSLCHTINFGALDRSDEEAVSNAIQTLYTARSVLTLHECASEPVGSDNGHFADADLLKHDIDKMLQELQTPPRSEEKQDKNQDRSKDQDKDKKDNQNRDSENKTEKEEQARQDELKKQLDQQKKDLENANNGSGDNGYNYIEGGSTSGYGDGTLW